MAWYSGMLGSNAAMNSQGYINPAAYPGGLQSTSTSTQAGSIMAIGTNTANQFYGASAQAQMSVGQQTKVYTVKNYTDAIGWDLVHHYLPVGITSDDPKIAMLKLVDVGEVLKDVGVRTSDTDYYVMREPSR
jgi:hypothetical protein